MDEELVNNCVGIMLNPEDECGDGGDSSMGSLEMDPDPLEGVVGDGEDDESCSSNSNSNNIQLPPEVKRLPSHLVVTPITISGKSQAGGSGLRVEPLRLNFRNQVDRREVLMDEEDFDEEEEDEVEAPSELYSTVSSSTSGVKLSIRRAAGTELPSGDEEEDSNDVEENDSNNRTSIKKLLSAINSSRGLTINKVQIQNVDPIMDSDSEEGECPTDVVEVIPVSKISNEPRVFTPAINSNSTITVEPIMASTSTPKRVGRPPKKSLPDLLPIAQSPMTGDTLSENRRTSRKRKPTKPFVHNEYQSTPRKVKVRIVEKVDEEEKPIPVATPVVTSPSDSDSPVKRRGRPSTGRGRGRPKGSVGRNRMDRDHASAAVDEAMESVIRQFPPTKEGSDEPEEEDEEENNEDNNEDSPEKIKTPTPVTPKPRKSRGGYRGSRGSRGFGSRRIVKARRFNERKKARKVTKPNEAPQVFEEETRMSGDIKLNSVAGPDDEASNMSTNSTTSKQKKGVKPEFEDSRPVTAETLFEYTWPQDDSSAQTPQTYFLQEQISEYLEVKGFKRKYPDLTRRPVEYLERKFLRDRKIVSETQADLGLFALTSVDVFNIMLNDFPAKYEAYRKAQQELKEREVKAQKPPPTPAQPRDKASEFMKRMIKSVTNWNAELNLQRKEKRSYTFDLQTNTLNIQESKRRVLPPEQTKVGYFPVTVLPGQFCDYYREYSPTELKYMPLNTVQYGPIIENIWDGPDSEESDSDSDSSSSSDDSSSSSDSDEESQNAWGEIMKDDTNSSHFVKFTKSKINEAEGSPVLCKTCDKDVTKNKDGEYEVLVHCTKCNVPNHPSCLELSIDMLPYIKKYNWQCTECKNCIECNDPADEDKMLFCDLCDRGYHIYCVGLRKVPIGRWHCGICAQCDSCGVKKPSTDDRMAEWFHEFKKGEKGSKFYVRSLCVSCHKSYKKGQFCPTCLKCHAKFDDKLLLECKSCEKWYHKGCTKKTLQTSVIGFMCESCDVNSKSKTKFPIHHFSKFSVQV